MSNLCYIAASPYTQALEQADIAEKIKESALGLMRQIYHQFSPAKVVFACDHQQYWRRDIFPEYKANRPHTPLKQLVRAAIKLIKTEKSKLCIEVEKCEADDVIYALTQHTDLPITIVSTDGDFIQLMSERVQIYNPMRRVLHPRPVQVDFSLFVKCIRGDRGDNIPAAYPRVSQRALVAAFGNKELTERIMKMRLKDGTVVGDNFKRNQTLIDLSKIPGDLQESLKEAIVV